MNNFLISTLSFNFFSLIAKFGQSLNFQTNELSDRGMFCWKREKNYLNKTVGAFFSEPFPVKLKYLNFFFNTQIRLDFSMATILGPTYWYCNLNKILRLVILRCKNILACPHLRNIAIERLCISSLRRVCHFLFTSIIHWLITFSKSALIVCAKCKSWMN